MSDEFKIKDLITFLEAEEEKAMSVLGRDKNFKELGRKRARAFWQIRQLIELRYPEITPKTLDEAKNLIRQNFVQVVNSIPSQQQPEIDEMYVEKKAREFIEKLMPSDEYLFPSGTVKHHVSMMSKFITQIISDVKGKPKSVSKTRIEECEDYLDIKILMYELGIEITPRTKPVKQPKEQTEIDKDWLPTAENINALPDPLRKYIADLETNADPAGMIQENMSLRATIEQLEAKLQEVPVVKIKPSIVKPDEDEKFPYECCEKCDRLIKQFACKGVPNAIECLYLLSKMKIKKKGGD